MILRSILSICLVVYLWYTSVQLLHSDLEKKTKLLYMAVNFGLFLLVLSLVLLFV